MKMTPVSHRMNMNRLSITRPCALMFSGSQCPCIGHQPAIAHTKMPTPKTGTIKNNKLQNRPTIYLLRTPPVQSGSFAFIYESAVRDTFSRASR